MWYSRDRSTRTRYTHQIHMCALFSKKRPLACMNERCHFHTIHIYMASWRGFRLPLVHSLAALNHPRETYNTTVKRETLVKKGHQCTYSRICPCLALILYLLKIRKASHILNASSQKPQPSEVGSGASTHTTAFGIHVDRLGTPASRTQKE